MSVAATRGVGVLARMLRKLGEGETGTVGEFATAEGFARSTVFDISRRLEAAGLVERDVDGRLHPGAASVKLALAEYGISALHGPAEALLAQLRDETQTNVRLVADDGTVMLAFAARRAAEAGQELTVAVTERVTVALAVRPSATRAERDDLQACAGRYAASLRHHLAVNGDEDG